MLTPQFTTKKLAQTLVLNQELYIKREDLHPLGSHKGRSIPIMIDKYAKQGTADFVISSSGNAALAAARVVKEYNKKNNKEKLTLTIFVGKNINPEKYAEILNCTQDDIKKNISLHKLDNPRQSAFLVDQNGDAKLLRQSTDDSALVGYEALAAELSTIRNLSAIFIPTSSGTTAQGLYKGFKQLKKNPQIHIVQTDYCHTLCGEDNLLEIIKPPTSVADAIVDNVGHRKQKVSEIIKNSGGQNWIATNNEIIKAIEEVKANTGLEISPNSALSIVGLTQALKENWKFDGPVVCIFTGK
ncbi:MAG: PLP-dependent lyase/thiolase [Candidatus Magasanikbacteria bacterium]